MKNIFFICLFLSMSLAVSGKKAQVSISCLKTEMLVNPQNIDCPSPRLSAGFTCTGTSIQESYE